jgi:hypothetical protein
MEQRMNTRRLMLAAGMGLLAACAPKPHLTQQQVEGVSGLGMEEVKARLGGPHVVTNAGDSVWWDYDRIMTPDGKDDGTCQIIFKQGRANTIKC